jgi:hypothetical protein
MFVAAYPREMQEMVFDAHNRAFTFFGGVPLRMVYDNLKAVVEAILVGKKRRFNRRFMSLANHYLFEPVGVACELTLECGIVTAAVVMNELRRLTVPARPAEINMPDQLRLQVEPLADCSRYDHLRGGQYVH